MSLAKGIATRSIDLEPIDRLEEKVKLLVGVIERLRSEGERLAEDNSRLSRELDQARSQLNEAEGASADVASLREERDIVRARVSDMLQQIEALNL
jgi:FtsZ-binding cell division protein ZapB